MDKLNLINIDTKSSEYHFVETLMLSAFPSDERRDESLQRHIVDDDDRMRCLVIKDGDVSVGFITVWTLTEIIYVEHFASYANIYGSVYAVALSMLWLYCCISIVFYGGALNHYLMDHRKK